MNTQSNQSESIEGFDSDVDKALTAAFERAKHGISATRITLDLAKQKWIIFSDLHRGARNGADDFWLAERAYNAALAYYFGKGHTLVILGDSEELWEERPQAVLREYRHSFALELAYHLEGRSLRVWGNHDDEWKYKARVEDKLGSLFKGLKRSDELRHLGVDPARLNAEVPELNVEECFLVEVKDGSEPVGRLFLIHGHQGDAKSDEWSWFSRHLVRYIWRPIQRLTNFSFNTPATRWDLRDKRNKAMYAWARKKNAEAEREADKLVLIAGHTHRPVFLSQGHEEQLLRKVNILKTKFPVEQSHTDHEQHLAGKQAWLGKQYLPEQSEKNRKEQLAAILAELEWVRAQERQTPRIRGEFTPKMPYYFNTGCGCYSDGDVTGIEIVGGKVKLIRFPDDAGAPAPKELEAANLREVFRAWMPDEVEDL